MNSDFNIHNYLDKIFTEIIAREKELPYETLKMGLEEELVVLSEYLGCGIDESLVFSGILLGTIHSEGITLDDLKRRLGFRAIQIFQLEKYKDELMSKDLICQEKRRFRSHNLYVDDYIYAQIAKGEKLVPKSNIFTEDGLFYQELAGLFERRENSELSVEQMFDCLKKIESKNPELPVFKVKNKVLEDWCEFTLFLYVCQEYAKGEDEVDYQLIIKKLFDQISVQFDLKRRFQKGSSIYMLEEYLELKEGNFRSANYIKLTDKAIAEIFEDLRVEHKKEFIPVYSKLIKSEEIEKKDLFFEGTVRTNLNLIREAVSPKRFDEIKKAFQAKGLKESVTGIFYGHPGTGKTESIYQLAAESGRHVIMVDIANIRDKYVGESEKRLKTVFNNYKRACEAFENTPILLFNEADALIGKRIDVSDSVDQMNNSMQNILLQELEDFSGIFLATTNLAASLDPAFERRFLFKVKFEKPAPVVRAKIWLEKFRGSITKTTALKLAEEFEFSGGEIDNIAKKALVHEVVLKKKLKYPMLKEFCEQEFLQKGGRTNFVGFKL
jgi:hypothetical protein